MASKIIQKEKERQEDLLKCRKNAFKASSHTWPNIVEICCVHKQSLINLKEYLEEDYDFLDRLVWSDHNMNQKGAEKTIKYKFKIKNDIEELSEMIEKYG